VVFDAKSQPTRFEWVTNGKPRGPSDLFDVPVYADRSAVAVPSVGSLVPGWTLVVPRRSAPNFAYLSREDRQALRPACLTVRARLAATFAGHIYEFEHGASAYGGALGCGVDQAHLHLVPLSFDLLNASKTLDTAGSFRLAPEDSDPWNRITSGVDYWFIRDTESGEGVVMFPRVAESQALRRLIAANVGTSEWDYTKRAIPKNAQITRRAFSVEP
jgi:ATP adenylyltransferase